jgi:FkbM family methyltransferase
MPLKAALKKSAVGRAVKDSWLHRHYQRSAGHWSYPFLALGWALAGWLMRPRWIRSGEVAFKIPVKNWVTHFRWYLFENKEREVRTFIDDFVKDGDVFFDVGANIGVFSMYAAKKFPSLSAYCFEPEYSNLALLKENILANELTDRVTPYAVGVGDVEGLSKLHLQDTAEGAAAHTESREAIDKTEEGYAVVWAEGIAVFTLDGLCKRLGVSPTVLKIDTDGGEGRILTGAAELLGNKELRAIVLERPQGDAAATCAQLLTAAGFKEQRPDNTLNAVWAR